MYDLEVAQGLDLIGSTQDGAGRSRTNGEHDFFRANLRITRVQNLPGEWSLLGTVGYAAMLKGDYDKAEKFYLQAIEKNPSFYKAPYKNLQILHHLKREER